MMTFCTFKDGNISLWYDYPETVEEFVDKRKDWLQKGVIMCFIENEHVWIYDSTTDELYEMPFLPDWCTNPY